MKFNFSVGSFFVSSDDLDGLMEQLREIRTLRSRDEVVKLAGHFKVCPCCSAVNTVTSTKCFVCSWYGQFETDKEHVHLGLIELLDKCPELLDAIAPEKKNLLAKMKIVWFNLFARFKRQRRLDLWA